MFSLTPNDEDSVRIIMKSAKHTLHERTRAHCLYLRNKQYTVIDVADILDLTPRTIINITNNYREGGLVKAIKDDPRPGRPRVFDDRTVAEIVALVCSKPPEGFDRWTLDCVKETVEKSNIVDSISTETIRIILHEHDLKPWQQKTWCIGVLVN